MMANQSRSLALTTLAALERGQYGNLVVDTTLKRVDMTEADRRLYTALVYGVTERLTTLDYLLGRFCDRPPETLDATVRGALRLGLYQLIYLDRVPDHAAIHETVELVPHRVRGYVNAILRTYLRYAATQPCRENHLHTPEDWAARFPELSSEPLTAAAVAYSLPPALCRVYLQACGEAEGHRLMAAFAQKPPLTLRLNPRKGDMPSLVAALEAAGLSPTPGRYLADALCLREGAVTSLPAFESGACFVQDEASQLCVKVLDARPGQLVVDTCACPGSKSFGAALDMDNVGQIYSFDLHQSKLSLIRSGAERLGLSILHTDCRDARQPDPALLGQADRVLCDVPCSGLGVIAKKPEIRHKDLSASARLPRIQRDILEASARYLKPGGRLVYATCTVVPAENQDVVTDFLATHPEFVPEDFAFAPLSSPNPAYMEQASAPEAVTQACIPSVPEPLVSVHGMATLMPHRHGTDAFFIARMRKL